MLLFKHECLKMALCFLLQPSFMPSPHSQFSPSYPGCLPQCYHSHHQSLLIRMKCKSLTTKRLIECLEIPECLNRRVNDTGLCGKQSKSHFLLCSCISVTALTLFCKVQFPSSLEARKIPF